jgi:superoxide dismutase, Fe-Mn family
MNLQIRQTIDLLETHGQVQLEQIKLPYGTNALSPVMNPELLNFHYGKLYKGYVDRYNSGEGDAGFNEAGAYLHAIWFGQFRAPGARQPHGTILSIIQRNHKNYQDFQKAMTESCMKLQGAGWVYLSKSGQIKTIHNHAKRTDIALLIDMWEHAFQMTYHADKAKYIKNLWRILDWDAINRRL